MLCAVAWLALDAIFDSRQVGHDPVLMHPDDSQTWYRKGLTYLQRRCYALRTDKIAPEILNGHLEIANGKRRMVD